MDTIWETLSANYLITALLIPAFGYVFNMFRQRRQEWKAWQSDRVDAEIRDFYGPLYAEILASEAVWRGFVNVFWPAHGGTAYEPDDAATTGEEVENWRRAVNEIFMPSNEKIERLILSNAHLLGPEGMPAAFKAMLIHVAGYRVIQNAWKSGDFRKHTSVNNFPQDMLQETEKRLNEAIARQMALRKATWL